MKEWIFDIASGIFAEYGQASIFQVRVSDEDGGKSMRRLHIDWFGKSHFAFRVALTYIEDVHLREKRPDAIEPVILGASVSGLTLSTTAASFEHTFRK